MDDGGRPSLASLLEGAPEEVRRIIADVTRPSGSSDPKRHHFIPQFYLRRFGRPSGWVHQIATVSLADPSRPRVGSVADTAVIADFYTVVDGNNADSIAVERLLGYVEREAKPAVDRLAAGILFPPQPADRLALSLWLGLQQVRGPHVRRSMEAIAEAAVRMQWSLVAEEEAARAFLRDRHGEESTSEQVHELLDSLADSDGLEVVPPQNEMVQVMLKSALEIAPLIFERYWAIVRFPETGLVTCDQPLLLYQHPHNRQPFVGVGIATADQIMVPLDRRTLLVLHSEEEIGDKVIDLPPHQSLREYNQMVVSKAKAEVYAHPDDLDRLTGLKFPEPDTPVLQMEGGAWIGWLPDGVNAPPGRPKARRYNKARNASRD